MTKRKHTVEEIKFKLREAEVVIATGSTVAEAAETENSRLKRAVAELTLDNQILKEAAEGNF